MHLSTTSLPLLFLLSSPLTLASPLSTVKSLFARSYWATGHAKMYLKPAGGELYMDLDDNPGKSDGSLGPCDIKPTLPVVATDCNCVVATGAIWNTLTCTAVITPDDPAEPDWPESVTVNWKGSYVLSSQGLSLGVQQPAPGDCKDTNGACAALKITV